MPNFCAFSYLLPGFSPTITTDVFLLTESVTLPPNDSIFSLISSRALLNVPDITKVLSVKFSSSIDFDNKHFSLTPISISFKTCSLL